MKVSLVDENIGITRSLYWCVNVHYIAVRSVISGGNERSVGVDEYGDPRKPRGVVFATAGLLIRCWQRSGIHGMRALLQDPHNNNKNKRSQLLILQQYSSPYYCCLYVHHTSHEARHHFLLAGSPGVAQHRWDIYPGRSNFILFSRWLRNKRAIAKTTKRSARHITATGCCFSRTWWPPGASNTTSSYDIILNKKPHNNQNRKPKKVHSCSRRYRLPLTALQQYIYIYI